MAGSDRFALVQRPPRGGAVRGGYAKTANFTLDEPALTTSRASVRIGRPQCDISTGSVIDASTVRVAPPITSSRQREWP